MMEIIKLGKTQSILNQYLAEIRDVHIQQDRIRFRRNMERIGEIMAYEISKQLDYGKRETQTPLAKAGTKILSSKIVLGTIFRAGIALHHGFLNYFDGAENLFISAYRKHATDKEFTIQLDYISGPALDDKVLIMVDPMLATAQSMEQAIRELIKSHGKPKYIHMAVVIATQYGVDYLKDRLSDLDCTLWTAAIDPDMNEQSYIVPGLGDAGDLAYGEKK